MSEQRDLLLVRARLCHALRELLRTAGNNGHELAIVTVVSVSITSARMDIRAASESDWLRRERFYRTRPGRAAACVGADVAPVDSAIRAQTGAEDRLVHAAAGLATSRFAARDASASPGSFAF